MSMTDTEAMTALINQFNQSSAQVMDVKTTTFELEGGVITSCERQDLETASGQ